MTTSNLPRPAAAAFRMLRRLTMALAIIGIGAQGAIALDTSQVTRAELRHFGKICKSIQIADDYLTQVDFNNDKLTDVITNPSGVTCDGVKAPECNMLGCPHRFYVQRDDGNFAMIAEIQFYNYSMYMRYGNQVLVLETQGGFCGRSTMETCKVTYRVRDTRFVELGRQ